MEDHIILIDQIMYITVGLGCPFVLEQCSKDTYPYLCNTTRTYQCTFDLVSRVSCGRIFNCSYIITQSLYRAARVINFYARVSQPVDKITILLH